MPEKLPWFYNEDIMFFPRIILTLHAIAFGVFDLLKTTFLLTPDRCLADNTPCYFTILGQEISAGKIWVTLLILLLAGKIALGSAPYIWWRKKFYIKVILLIFLVSNILYYSYLSTSCITILFSDAPQDRLEFAETYLTIYFYYLIVCFLSLLLLMSKTSKNILIVSQRSGL